VNRAALWILVPLAVVGACARQVTSTERLCTPGNYVFCRCKDGSEGTKLCNDNGQSFQPCDACDPGDEVPTEPPKVDSSTGDDEDANQGTPDVQQPPDDAPLDVPPGVVKPTPGEVLISEVMYDPSGTEPDEEWIEVYNATTEPRLLSGLTIKDGGNRTATIDTGATPLVIAGHDFLVLARNKTAAIAAQVSENAIVFEYGAGQPPTSGILLANSGGGAVWIVDGTTTIAGAQYGGWFQMTAPGGKSIQLATLTLDASADKTKWCLSANAFGPGSDLGTPGAQNDCP
jgi:hypothetical protein